MNLLIQTKRAERGSVISTVLIISGLVAIMVAAQLTLLSRQNSYTARSQTWAAEIPIAEAGVEEAMAVLNLKMPNVTNMTNNGWALVGTNYVKSRAIGDGYFYTAVSTSTPPVILSIGYARVPTQTNYTSRAILVTTTTKMARYGIIGLENVSLDVMGTTLIDSFDSTIAPYNVRSNDMAGVATLSTLTNAINAGSGVIYGYAATGPGGGARGTIGSFAWTAGNPGVPQPDHVRDDFFIDAPALGEPFTGGIATLPAGKVDGTNYQYVLGKDTQYNYKGDLSVDTIYVTNSCSLIVDSIRMSGGKNPGIYVKDGVGFSLYVRNDATITGGGIVNLAGVATNIVIYGLSTCTSIRYGGQTRFVGRIYAPQAAITFSGGNENFGAYLGRTLDIKGGVKVHYDQSLGLPIYAPLRIASWEEL